LSNKHALAHRDEFLMVFGTISALGGCWSEEVKGSSGGGGNFAEPIGNLAEAKVVKQATKSARAGASRISETVAGLDQPIMARLREQN
jgi:hypothetical protein